ncbi:hypothetical protein NE237_005401 [Protea cynaroides]|uniref:Exostosin GT47 domain-containing protein n=1 Tax=Protea cynaroides TaxID=273540 RepID=A0A9Q0KKP0_9MAGN|nr:hypothetical protein NE237_005401 [Protea cynaroides]
MAERNPPFRCIISRSSLFCMLAIATFLFLFSWLSVLRSTSRPHFVDHSSLPNSKLFAVVEDGNSQPRNQDNIQPSIPKMSVSVDYEEEGPQVKELMKYNQNKVVLKVFMYDLSPEFHFGLLNWKPEGGSVWPDIKTKIPDYPGGLNLQHSIEYWLTLDLLSSTFPDSKGGRSAVRVHNSSEADVIFVPFFSSVSYNRYSRLQPHEKKNRNQLLQEKLVKFLTAQEEWKRSGGHDHIIMAHHPNSLLDARMMLWPAMFILADFGRYPPNIANVEKDVIAPYKHIIKTFVNDSSGFDDRQTLLYFQGAIYRKDGGFVRQELFYLLKDEKDVHFAFGSVSGDGINIASKGMHSSKFCLNIAGDTPSSNRLFDAIASHCVPVIISDEIELPYEDVLDYSEFCVFVRTSDAVQKNFLIKLIRSIKKEEWTQKWKRLKEIEKFFEFQYPSQEDDAVQMIWQAVARKVPSVRLKLHKSKRFSRHKGSRRKFNAITVPRNFG